MKKNRKYSYSVPNRCVECPNLNWTARLRRGYRKVYFCDKVNCENYPYFGEGHTFQPPHKTGRNWSNPL